MLLKEEDVDQFKDFIANYVGIELFGDADYYYNDTRRCFCPFDIFHCNID